MASSRFLIACVGVGGLILQGTLPAAPAATRLVVDAGRSHVVIEVGKAGVLGFAGHAHEVQAPAVRGSVTVDPADWRQSAVSLDFDAAALRVSGSGEPPADVPKVQQVMVSDRVLDAARFPSVAFRSRTVSVVGGTPAAPVVRIDGDVTLHGVTRPLSVRASTAFEGLDTLTARGDFSLKQSDFGIEPVTAAGGSIKVRDEVNVRFVLVAHRQ